MFKSLLSGALSPIVARITSIAALCLLLATLILGMLLKHSYEAHGKLQAQVNTLKTDNSALMKQNRDVSESCKDTDALVTDGVVIKRDNTERGLSFIDELRKEKLNGKEVSRSDLLSADTDRVLRLAECSAKASPDCPTR